MVNMREDTVKQKRAMANFIFLYATITSFFFLVSITFPLAFESKKRDDFSVEPARILKSPS